MGETMRLRNLFALALALMVVAAVTLVASAETKWPTRPVRFILTLGAGSGSDIGARLLADRLSQRWGQPVIVENRPGGDAIVAINAFVSAHDDHVLLFSPTSSFTAHAFLHDNLPYQPSDLVPITRVSNTIITISVPASLNVNSLKELAAMARAEPGKLNWAGVTGALDFVFAGWLKQEGLNINKVPYRNPVDAANDLAEGRVQVYEAALAIVRPQLESGKIKLLAVTNSVRAPTQPNLPTVAEAGYPALTIDGLVGLVWTDRNAARSAPTHHRRHPRGGRSDHRGSPDHHRTAHQYRRAGRVRQIDRRAARQDRGLRQAARHQSDVAEATASQFLSPQAPSQGKPCRPR